MRVRESLGSARVSRVGERVLPIANFVCDFKASLAAKRNGSLFRRDARTKSPRRPLSRGDRCDIAGRFPVERR
jgi:hypothetical protein